jgi:hypothetical protein
VRLQCTDRVCAACALCCYGNKRAALHVLPVISFARQRFLITILLFACACTCTVALT